MVKSPLTSKSDHPIIALFGFCLHPKFSISIETVKSGGCISKPCQAWLSIGARKKCPVVNTPLALVSYLQKPLDDQILLGAIHLALERNTLC